MRASVFIAIKVSADPFPRQTVFISMFGVHALSSLYRFHLLKLATFSPHGDSDSRLCCSLVFEVTTTPLGRPEGGKDTVNQIQIQGNPYKETMLEGLKEVQHMPFRVALHPLQNILKTSKTKHPPCEQELQGQRAQQDHHVAPEHERGQGEQPQRPRHVVPQPSLRGRGYKFSA